MSLSDQRTHILEILKCGARYDKQPPVYQAGFDYAADEAIMIILEFMQEMKDVYSTASPHIQWGIEDVLVQMLDYKTEDAKKLMEE